MIAASEALEDPAALLRLAQLLVPTVADWFLLDVMDAEGPTPAAWWHVDPRKTPMVAQLHRDHPVDLSSDQPQARALHTRASVVLERLTEQMLFIAARDDEHLRRLKALDPQSLLAVPLLARARPVGVMTLVYSTSGRRYGPGERALLEQLANPLAFALDNRQLYLGLRNELKRQNDRERYLRTVLHQLPGAVWAVDRDLRITYANGALPGVPADGAREVLGSTLYEFLGTSDSRNTIVARHLDAMSGARQSFETEFRGRWFQTVVEPLRDELSATIIGSVGAAFDVTERREALERIARGEARLAEAQSVAHVGSFEWDIAPNTLTWSEELRRIYGLSKGTEPRSYDDFLARVHPDDLELTRTVVFDAYQQAKSFIYDHRIVRMDGSVRMLHTRGDVIKDGRGKAIRLVGTCWDVTELTEATRAREQVTSVLQATLEATADGIVAVDSARRVVLYNQRFLDEWGIPKEVVTGRTEDALVSLMRGHVANLSDFDQATNELQQHPQEDTTDVIRLKDGRVFERYSRPQRVGDAIVGRVSSFRDISEHDRSLRRTQFISDANRLLTSLDVETALKAVAQLAVPYLGDGCAIDLFGVEAPRRLVALCRNPQCGVPPEVHRSVTAGHPVLYRTGPLSHMSVPLLVKAGLAGALSFSACPERTYTSDHLEIAQELARRAAQALDNTRLYQRVQRALATRDEFLTVAAHEIRGPLTSIHLTVQALRTGNLVGPVTARMLGVLEREDRRLSQFVNELLDLGRIQGGQFHLELERVDLGEVVREVIARLGEEVARSGSPLTLAAEGQVLGQWDRFRVDQVVHNLLSNAIKFGLGRPIQVTVRAMSGWGVLVVSDHGSGISADMRQRIFNPFERGVPTHHYGGLGVGLFIVHTIVTALGGTVGVESELGSGTTFTVELPMAGGFDDDPQARTRGGR